LKYITNIKEKKRIILEREQYYLDNIQPSLNVYKIANSPLGIKRSIESIIKFSKSRRGKKIKRLKTNTVPRVITTNTKFKMSLRCQGISVKIFDKCNNLINQFPTLNSAAVYLGINRATLSNIFETGISYDDYVYKFELKDIRI